jgi:hypothetical protein
MGGGARHRRRARRHAQNYVRFQIHRRFRLVVASLVLCIAAVTAFVFGLVTNNWLIALSFLIPLVLLSCRYLYIVLVEIPRNIIDAQSYKIKICWANYLHSSD